MFECDVDRAAQILSRGIRDHDRNDSGDDLEGGIYAIFFMSLELLKRPVDGDLQVLVAQQCSHSKA